METNTNTETASGAIVTRAVRTKTGSKVHLAFGNSSRTLCGARVALVLKTVGRNAAPCIACGLQPEMTAETLAQWFGLPEPR